MHMARLADPSRMRYGLKYLTQDMESQIVDTKKGIIAWMKDQINKEGDSDKN